MSHSYCINDERPASLASAKQEAANGALWGRVDPTLSPLPCGIWPFNAYLLSIKYVNVHAGAEMPPEKRGGGQLALALYVFFAPSGGQHRPGLGTSAPPIHPRVLSN